MASPMSSFTSVCVLGREKCVCSFIKTIEGKMKVTAHAAGNLALFRDTGLILCCLTTYPSLSKLVVLKWPSF